MAQFLIMVILDLTKVIYHPVQIVPLLVVFLLILTLTWLLWFCYINFSGQSGAFLLLLLLILLATVFLLIAPNLYRKLRVVRIRQSYQWFEIPSFKFFWLGVFCYLGLRVDLGRSSVHQLIPSIVVLINVTSDRGLYLGFGLSPSGFFN